MKKDFVLSIVFIAVGIFATILGFNLEQMIQTKYALIPSYVAKPSLIEDAGPIWASFGGISATLIGLIMLIVSIVHMNKPLKEKEGKIIQIIKSYRDYNLVMVEYTDGERVKLNIPKKINIITGDYGIIGTKGNIAESFKPIKQA